MTDYIKLKYNIYILTCERSIIMCDKDEKWSSIKEIYKHLEIGRDTVMKWITEKDIPAVKSDIFGNLKFQRWIYG